jgi:hypothetical protein
MTELMNLVVNPAAIANTPGTSLRIPIADVAPIEIAKSIGILDTHRNDIANVSAGDSSLTNQWRRNRIFTLHKNSFKIGCFFWFRTQFTFTKSFEPIVCLFHGVSPSENPALLLQMQGRRFAVVKIININTQQISRWRKLGGVNFGREDVWPLIPLEEISSSSQLQKTDERISKNQDGSYYGPKYLLLGGCCILATLSLMLVFKALDYVYLNTGFNVNVATGGFLFSAILFGGGGLLMLSVFVHSSWAAIP